jgi:hypothetical protein
MSRKDGSHEISGVVLDGGDKIGSKKPTPQINEQGLSGVRHSVSVIIYPLFLFLLVVFMILAISISGLMIYHVAKELIEPDWMRASLPLINKISQLFNPTDNETSRTLDAVFIAITALMMGIFLKRCASENNRLEVVLIVFFTLAAMLQLSLILIMPGAEVAASIISDGDKFVTKLSIILSRNANIAIAISFAAMGIQLNRDERSERY